MHVCAECGDVIVLLWFTCIYCNTILKWTIVHVHCTCKRYTLIMRVRTHVHSFGACDLIVCFCFIFSSHKVDKLRNGGSLSVINSQSLGGGSPEMGSGMLAKSDQNSPPSSLTATQDMKMVQYST